MQEKLKKIIVNNIAMLQKVVKKENKRKRIITTSFITEQENDMIT